MADEKKPIDPLEAARLRKVKDAFDTRSHLPKPVVPVQQKSAVGTIGVAPEVSQGQWRERSSAPRALLSREQVLTELTDALEKAKVSEHEFEKVRSNLFTIWTPLLRQVFEQAGGDGLDARISQLIGKNPKQSQNPVIDELAERGRKLRQAKDAKELFTAAEETISWAGKTLQKPERLSLAAIDRDLEGRMEVSDFLVLFFATEAEMTRKLDEMTVTLEKLRTELRAMPGGHVGGMFWNFGRLKAEKQIWEAERKRRGAVGAR